MKVLLTASRWGHAGGVERYLMQLIRSLHRFGHESSLLYAQRTEKPIEEPLPLSGTYAVPALTQYPSRRNRDAVKNVLDIVEQEHPDIIYFREVSHYDLLDALSAVYPTVGMLHGNISLCLRDSKMFYFRRKICTRRLGLGCLLHGHFLSKPRPGHWVPRYHSLSKALKLLDALRRTDRLLIPSGYLKEELLKHGFASDHVRVLPHYTSIPELDVTSTYPREPMVLFVGRLSDRYKGADVLMEALHRCRTPVRAVVIGEGAFLPKVKARCDALGLRDRVTFLGWKTHEELSAFYQRAAVVVVPSILPEGFGRVGIEAMAHGAPVVAFRAGGITEWLRDGETGFAVDWMDREGMAQRIDQLVGDEDLVQRMGLCGRATVLQRHTEDVNIRGLLKTFEEVISARRSQIDDFNVQGVPKSLVVRHEPLNLEP